MKFLTSQQDSDFFVWQLEVQINNFRKFGLEKNMIILMGYDKSKGINPNAKKICAKTKALIFFIPDDRPDKSYIPSLKPYLAMKFYKQNKVVEPIFYIDSDVIFIGRPDLDQMLSYKDVIVLSDTVSYIGAKYIKSKSEILLQEMCDIVGVNKELVERNEMNSGGAQILFNKPVTFEYWNKVYNDSVALFHYMKKTAEKYTPENDIPIQAWTAEMWATLWNIWLLGHETKVIKEMDFAFATDLIENLNGKTILHNAGVMNGCKCNGMFYKGDYQNSSGSPYGLDFSYISNRFCSSLYVKEIIDTGIYMK